MKSIVDSISDLSLLEISGEDDSLLSGNTPAATAANVFSCSPLVSARSRPRQIKGSEIDNVDSEDLDSLRNDSANKENAKWSKPEGVDSSQKKKRKKKLGGFNLRKSLAWDRAFFTEQGVLNPLELSMISGTVTPNSKTNLNLEAIEEEEPATTSLALQEIEENLFKHSSGGVSIRNRKIGAVSALSPKPGSSIKRTTPVASLAKRKILAVNDVGNKYKRSACPRPVVTSSSTDTIKTPSKQSKVTRIPGPKSSVSATATTSRSGMLSSGSLKRNQNAHPVNNAPKYAAVKGLSKNPRTVPSNSKVDLADKCSVSRTLTKQDGKHSGNSVSEICAPSRMHQTGSGAKKVSETGFPLSIMHQTGSGANKASEACVPQGISDTDKKKQQTLFQTTKLSGLRKPSPSIGFFSQAKASSSNGQLQKSSIPSKPSESNIPKLRKLGTSSVNEARSKIVQGAAKIHTKELSLSDAKSEPVMQIDNKQMAGVEVECDSSSFEKISKQPEVKNILEDVLLKSKEQEELHENEHDYGKGSMVLPTHEKELLTKSHTHEQLERETDHAPDDKLYDVSSNGGQSSFQEPQATHCPIMQETSNNVHNAIGQDEDDQIKGPTCDIPAFKEGLVLQADHETSIKDDRNSGEFKECNSVKAAPLNCSLDDFRKTVPEGSKQETPCKNTEQVNCGAGEFGRFGEDAQVHSLNENLSINCNEINQSNLEAVSRQLQGEKLKIPNPSSVGEIGSEKENMSDMKSSQPFHVLTLFSKGSPEKSILETDGASENESKITEIKECQLPVDVQSGFISRGQMDEEYDKVIDSKAIHDRTQEFELDSTNVTNVEEKAGCGSRGNDIPVTTSNPISESPCRDDNFSTDTSIHCEVPGNIEQQASIFTYPEINELSCEDDSLVPSHGHLIHQSEFSEVSPDVISNIEDPIGSGAENSSSLLQHTLLAQSIQEFDHTNREIEESHEEVSPDVISNIKDPIGSGAEDSSGLLQHTLPAQSVQEFDDTDREIAESHEEVAQAQSFNEIPMAYDFSNKHCLAVTDDQLSLADDNNINEVSHLPEFQKRSAVATGDNKLHLDSDFLLPTIIFPSAEIKEQNLVDGAFEECRFDTNDHGASNHHTYREIKEIHMEDAQQSFDESPVAYDCRSKHCPAVINDQFSLADDNNRNEDSHLPELQKPSDVVALDSQYVNNILHLDRECVPTNIASSAEIKEENLVEGAFEWCRSQSNEHSPSNHHIQDMSENKDRNHDGDRVEVLQIDGAEKRSTDISPEVEVQLNENVISTEFDSSATEVGEDPFEGCRFHSNEHDTSNHHIQDMPETKDGNHDVDERVELLQINGAEEGSSDILPVVEIQLNETVTSAEFDSSTTEVSVDPFEGCRFHCNEHDTSNHHIQDMPENKDENHDVDERVELLQIDGAEGVSSDISSIVEIQLNETVISTFNATIQQDSEVSSVNFNENVISAEFDFSIEVSEDTFTSSVACKSEENCFSSEKSKLTSDNPTFNATIPQGTDASSVNGESLSDVGETNICGNDKFPNTDMLCQTKCNINFPEDNSNMIHLEKVEKAVTKSKQEVPKVKPPPNVAPFTEEWLAAIEAAGEEILTMKGGAVQNSPPEKVQHEPSPWSPVKKNQAIGPFDCTKVTKHNIQNSDPS